MRYMKYGLGFALIIGLTAKTVPATSTKSSHPSPLAGATKVSTASSKSSYGLNYRFTVPPQLRPNVDFWKKVYTEYTSEQALIHDKEYLHVIYTVLDFSDLNNTRRSYRARRRIERNRATEAKQKYRKILKKLAKPNLKLDKLSAEEKRVYDLFSSVDERNKFRKATARRRIRSQVGQRDRFIKGLINSGAYMRHIEKVFSHYGLPQELTLLPFVESFFNTSARSNDGAVGIWQFIYSTGRYYLKINSVIDERKDPYKSSDAAARHLRNNYKKLGSWPLAITAYNHGSAGMRRAVRKTGHTDLVGIIQKYRSRIFGFASKNFYAEFLAVLEIVPNHDRYFGRLKLKPSQKFDVVDMPDYVSLKTLTKHCAISKAETKRLNPAFKTSILSSKKYIPKGYPLHIPVGTTNSFLKSYAQIPKKLQYAAQKQDDWHRVRWGETLSQIARRYRTSIRSLVDLNNLSSSRYIRAGQRLRIPHTGYKAGKKAATKVAMAETKPATSKKARVKKTTYTRLVKKKNKSKTKDRIIVKPHESLGHYADWAQVSAARIRRLNGLGYNQRIHVGQSIKISHSKVGGEEFEQKREVFHRQIQQEFLDKHKIERIHSHTIRPRQNVWYLCRYEYKVPLWLVEKYNQDKNLTRLNVGDEVLIPIVVKKL